MVACNPSRVGPFLTDRVLSQLVQAISKCVICVQSPSRTLRIYPTLLCADTRAEVSSRL